MRAFVCLPNGAAELHRDGLRRGYEWLARSRGLPFRWRVVGRAATLLIWDDIPHEPVFVSEGAWIGMGTVRLDNRRDVVQWAESESRCTTDLGLVLRMVGRHGSRYVPDLLGDFGFVVCNVRTGSTVAACDPFAVHKLYVARTAGTIAFASRAEALAPNERYDRRYLADMLAGRMPDPETTAYNGVAAVQAGTMLLDDGTGLTVRRYWSAGAFEREAASAASMLEQADRCRELMTDAVRLRVDDDGSSWVQLSGGLDSSSVVSLAQSLVGGGEQRCGIGGTVTYVDRPGTSADERKFSDAVAARWRVRNEQIVNAPSWVDGEADGPLLTDLPNLRYPTWPRERRLGAVVRSAGGRSLLTGIGGDELFMGHRVFLADYVARGRVGRAVRAAAHAAATERGSFWRLLYRDAIMPLMPQRVALTLTPGHDQRLLPPWFRRDTAREFGIREYGMLGSVHTGRAGHKYFDLMLAKFGAVAGTTSYQVIADELDVRHPFLYRPLVEFALQLPADFCVRPRWSKGILREAMRGILPEMVRTRVGTGGIGDLVRWSFTTYRSIFEQLADEPVLADLGVIEPAPLRAAVDEALHMGARDAHVPVLVLSTLAIEAWLRARTGRWPRSTQPRESGTRTVQQSRDV